MAMKKLTAISGAIVFPKRSFRSRKLLSGNSSIAINNANIRGMNILAAALSMIKISTIENSNNATRA
jgi:hypothetical protein